ncbi:MAG: hypothetical protein Q4B99_02885 [Clostridia bacterium]|nr:hypothetical protein [Clostridia bacterium]
MTKKTYEKPMLYCENLALSEALCASCGHQANLAENQCGIIIPGLPGTVFTTAIAGCTYVAPPPGICYQVPTAGNNGFAS